MSRIQTYKKIITLILCFSLLAWIMIMYNDYSAMLPLFMFTTLLIMEGLPFFAGVSKVNVSIRVDQDIRQFNDKFRFDVCVSDKTFYPFKMTQMVIEIKRKYGNEIIRRKIEIPMNGKGKYHMGISEELQGCGYVTIEAKTIRIYDVLGIFSRKCKKKKSLVEVVILPAVHEMFIDLESVPYIEVDESDIFSKDKAGNDVSELFGIRPFMDGDSLNKVHWNLSARTNETMVREFSMPVESNIYVYIDLYKNADVEKALQDGISAAYELMAAESPFFMCWFDETELCMRRQQPKSFEEIDEIMCKILRLNLFDRNPMIDEILNRFSNESHIVFPVFRLPESY